MMKRREFIKKIGLATSLVCGPLLSCSGPRKKAKPNIIFMLADDQRWDTLGCMGNDIIHTPQLDQLANDGVLFKNHFVTYSYCAPSRASFLSGLYYDQHGIARKREWKSELFAKTYPVLLREAGYFTGFIGKWHMGETKDEAFDYSWMFSGQGSFFGMVPGDDRHLTRTMTDKALECIDAAGDQPFCLSISYKAPHVDQGAEKAFDYDPELESLYENVTIPPPATDDFENQPEFIQNSEGRVRWHQRFSTPELYQEMVKGYYRLITGIDNSVGKISEHLKHKGLDHNTILIFTGDNGFFLGEHGLAGKWLMYEESIRTPLIVHDPRLNPDQKGQVREEMTLNIDIAPTIMELAGIEIPDHIKGKSIVPLVQNQQNNWRDAWFYQHYAYGGDPDAKVYIPQSEGIRTERWKYIRYVGKDPVFEQLFDLENDPHETKNLVFQTEFHDILSEMRDRFLSLKKEATQ